MNLKNNVEEFLTLVLAEIGEQDAAAMFGFLGTAIKSNPGKLANLAKHLKDPDTLKDIQALATTKSKLALTGKIVSLYNKLS